MSTRKNLNISLKRNKKNLHKNQLKSQDKQKDNINLDKDKNIHKMNQDPSKDNKEIKILVKKNLKDRPKIQNQISKNTKNEKPRKK